MIGAWLILESAGEAGGWRATVVGGQMWRVLLRMCRRWGKVSGDSASVTVPYCLRAMLASLARGMSL